MTQATSVTTKVKIQKVRFITNLKGNIVPLLYLEKNEDLEKNNMDMNALIFNDLEPVAEGMGSGSEMLIEFSERGVPDIKEVLVKSGEGLDLPNFCPTCGERVFYFQNQPSCSNHYCPATSRAPIYRLFEVATLCKIEDAVIMLGKYPIAGSDTGSVDNLEELGLALSVMKDKNTQSRLNHWTAAHGGAYGEYLWNIEKKLEEYLKLPHMFISDFWRVCNFKDITEEEFQTLALFSPSEITPLMGSEVFDAMPKRVNDLITVNYEKIVWLKKFFEKFGKKEWKR